MKSKSTDPMELARPAHLRGTPPPAEWARADWMARADTLRRWSAEALAWATKPGAVTRSPLGAAATAAALRSAGLAMTAAAEVIDLVTRAEPRGPETPPRTR